MFSHARTTNQSVYLNRSQKWLPYHKNMGEAYNRETHSWMEWQTIVVRTKSSILPQAFTKYENVADEGMQRTALVETLGGECIQIHEILTLSRMLFFEVVTSLTDALRRYVSQKWNSFKAKANPRGRQMFNFACDSGTNFQKCSFVPLRWFV